MKHIPWISFCNCIEHVGNSLVRDIIAHHSCFPGFRSHHKMLYCCCSVRRMPWEDHGNARYHQRPLSRSLSQGKTCCKFEFGLTFVHKWANLGLKCGRKYLQLWPNQPSGSYNRLYGLRWRQKRCHKIDCLSWLIHPVHVARCGQIILKENWIRAVSG